MAIEVDELVIRANIDPSSESGQKNALPDYEELVSECVEQVLRVLDRKEKR